MYVVGRPTTLYFCTDKKYVAKGPTVKAMHKEKASHSGRTEVRKIEYTSGIHKSYGKSYSHRDHNKFNMDIYSEGA